MTVDLRIIETNEITEAVSGLCVKANTCVGNDIRCALTKAKSLETLPSAISALDTMIKNAEIAEHERLPVCQDTGMVVIFVKIGADVHINGNINEAINEGVRRGYREGYCRNSVVHDPIKRENTGDNTPAVIHPEFVPGDKLEITVAPKGFGSENMSGVCMLTPSDGLSGVEDFILETIRVAGANPCPPIIIGVGIGGTMEKVALLSKRALLRDVGSVHTDPFWEKIEAKLLKRVNELGIGSAGFGGRTTALGVHILTYPTHIAGLPVAVNIGCHATRHQTVIL